MDTYRARTRRWLALAAILTAALAGVAYAMDVPFDPVAWGSNPALALLALAGAVAWARTTELGRRLDGAILVPLFTLAAGAIAGAALQIANLLTYQPYGAWATPLGGIAYGLLIASSAIVGVSLFNYGASKLKADKSPAATAIQFITQLLIARFQDSIPTKAWHAVAPLLQKYALSDAILTDALRAELQAQVLEALRAAGLAGYDL